MVALKADRPGYAQLKVPIGEVKALIETLSESLLESFRQAPLIDAYDMYQHLMDLWSETLQDDVYMIVSDGWKDAAKPRLILDDFAKQAVAIEGMEAEAAGIDQKLEELKEEHGGEEGLMAEVVESDQRR